MSEKPEKKFQWDESALIPDSITIDFAPLLGKEEKVEVTFYELPRMDLTKFVTTTLDLQVYETNEDGSLKMKGPEGAQVPIKKSLDTVEKDSSAHIFRYLALSTRGKQKEKFFEDLPLTAQGMAALSEMLLEINHVQEIIATSGNWLMLPTMLEMYAEAKANDASDSPAETTPA